MQLRVELYSDTISSEQLYSLIDDETMWKSSDIDIKLVRKNTIFRNSTLDPTVLVALIGGVGAGLSALIVGVFKLLEKKTNSIGVIEIHGSDGRCIKVPANTKEDQLMLLVELANKLDNPKIKLNETYGQ